MRKLDLSVRIVDPKTFSYAERPTITIAQVKGRFPLQQAVGASLLVLISLGSGLWYIIKKRGKKQWKNQ